MASKIKKIEKVNDSFSVYRYDNGWMIEISGRNDDGDYKTTKITCNTEDELFALIKEYNTMPLDD